jgi:hypothetical protein
LRSSPILAILLLLLTPVLPAVAGEGLPAVPSFRMAEPGAAPAAGPAPPRGSGGGGSASGGGYWFAGGGLGLSFGTVDYVEIYPVIGYRFKAPISLGVQFLYRYSNDDRYAGDSATTDYGATLFFRYFVIENFFVEADYEYLSYEYLYYVNDVGEVGTRRTEAGNVFLGVGYSQPIGRKSAFFVSVLYNVTFDDAPDAPYADPWLIRAGVSFGF